MAYGLEEREREIQSEGDRVTDDDRNDKVQLTKKLRSKLKWDEIHEIDRRSESLSD